jgi:hypothetical protein
MDEAIRLPGHGFVIFYTSREAAQINSADSRLRDLQPAKGEG